MEGYMAEIRMFAPDFAPRTWAFCNGQIMPINTNQALFSLLGTTFGGNGVTTFALPDFRGRTAVGTGSSGGPVYTLGMVTGTESTLLNTSNIPPHTHNAVTGTASMLTSPTPGGVPSPAGAYFANDESSKFDNNHDSVTMAPISLNLAAGGSGASGVNNMMPFLGMNYIICLQGIFPSRN